ncbi:MAG TPA: ribosome-associated translation inhibitor RaiA [Beijerinckiaceae bacterium]|nr:ribosome-associated translation inhibitor RaiA [Beijerinckiaceae bacterium]
MGLRVSGKNFAIGEAMTHHVHDRIAAAADKYFDGSVSGHVVVEHEGSGYRADCTLHLTSGVTMQAEGRAHDPYLSFDQAADRLEKRLRRYKRRLKDHHPGSNNAAASGGGPDQDVVADYVIEAPDSEAADPQGFDAVVIAEQTKALRTMAVAAAVLELDFTGAPVLVFRHAGSGRVNVVYRRSDGNIGWIDPSTQETPLTNHSS